MSYKKNKDSSYGNYINEYNKSSTKSKKQRERLVKNSSNSEDRTKIEKFRKQVDKIKIFRDSDDIISLVKDSERAAEKKKINQKLERFSKYISVDKYKKFEIKKVNSDYKPDVKYVYNFEKSVDYHLAKFLDREWERIIYIMKFKNLVDDLEKFGNKAESNCKEINRISSSKYSYLYPSSWITGFNNLKENIVKLIKNLFKRGD